MLHSAKGRSGHSHPVLYGPPGSAIWLYVGTAHCGQHLPGGLLHPVLENLPDGTPVPSPRMRPP